MREREREGEGGGGGYVMQTGTFMSSKRRKKAEGGQTDIRETDRQRQTERRTDRQTNRRADKQTGDARELDHKHTHTHTRPGARA